MSKSSTLLTLALALGLSQATAQEVSQSEALSRAQEFLQQASRHAAPRQGGNSSVELTLAHVSQRQSDQRPLYYAFNQGEDQGFILVGGDESAQQILGYCSTGSFDFDNLPANFRWWLSQYDQQISAAIDQGPIDLNQRQQAGGRRAAANASRLTIKPLVEAKWSQEKPYSDMVNAAFYEQTKVQVNSLVTGCVATAIAQVMKHYNYPEHGSGSATGTSRNYDIGGQTVTFTPSANFGAATYDWPNMRILENKEVNSYSGSYTEAQGNAVAQLMYHVGVSVDMNYGTSSGASSSKIPYALSTYFGYDKSISYEERKFYTDDDWEELVYNELAHGRPVLYGGQADNGQGGHEFVCDGYRQSDGLFSFNWGWGHLCDGYYRLTGTYALKPGSSGTGGAGDDAAYTGDQDVIINVMPDAGGKELPLLKEHTQGSLSMTVNGTTQSTYNYTKSTEDAMCTVYTNLFNFSTTLTQFTLGVRAFDRNTGIVHYWNCKDETIDLPVFYTGSNHFSIDVRNEYLTVNLHDLTYNGTYELRPVCRQQSSTSDEDWVLVKEYNTDVIPQVIVTGASAVATQDITFTISANQVEVNRTIQIDHDAAYKGNITYSGYDATILSVDDNGVVTGLSEGTTTITVTGASYSINGNELFHQTETQFEVSVIATQKTTPEVTISSVDFPVGGTATITVEGYVGSESITYTSSNTAVATVANDGTVTGVSAGTADITVSVPATALTNAVNKVFTVNVSAFSILFKDEPYMTNGSDDLLKLYLPLKNFGNTTASEPLYCAYQYKVGNTTYNSTTGYNPITWPAGYSSVLSITLNANVANYPDGTKIPVYFYRDKEKTIPANVPSYTFTYHETVPSYTLTDAGWGTLMMPVASALPTTDDWKFYSCSSVSDDGVLTLEEVSTLERNKPYIVSGSAGTVSFTNSDWVDSHRLFTEGLLTGVLSEQAYTFQQGDYILQKQNAGVAFYQITADSPKLGAAANPLRAFIQQPSSAKASLRFPSDDEESISSICVDQRSAGIYGIDGTRRETLQKGMNIVVAEDGKVIKMYVK